MTVILSIGGSALEITEPDQDSFHEGGEVDYTIQNIDEESNADSLNVTFDGPDIFVTTYTIEEEGSQVEDSRDIGEGDYGEYEIIAEVLDEEGESLQNDTVEAVTADGSDPDFEDESPTGVIDFDDPDIKATVTDDISGLENATLEFEGVEVNDSGLDGDESVDLEIESGDYDSLDDGTHTAEVEAFDRSGNQLDGSWSFTVDTTSPDPDDFDLDPSEGLREVQWGEDFTVEVSFEATEEHESDVEAYCIIDGNEEDSHDLGDLDDGDEEDFECDISDDYFDQSVDFEVELEDEAGNSWDSDVYVYDLDASSPSIESFLTEGNVSIINDDFDMEYEVSGGVGEVDIVEYFIGDDPGLDDGTQFNDAEGSFTVESDDLESGEENDISFRARDSFDRWSSTETFTVEYLPGELPEAEMTLEDEELNITSGDLEVLEVELENTGVLLVRSGEVESEELNSSISYDGLEPDESESMFFDIEFEDLGEKEVDFEASSVDASANLDVLMTANDDQRDDIDEEFESLDSEFMNLTEDIDELKPSLSSERAERLEDEFEPVESQMNDIENAIDEGRYYEASSLISGMEREIQSARNTFEDIEEEHAVAVRNRYIMLGFLFILLSVGGGVGFVLYSDEYEVDIESIDIDGLKTTVEEQSKKISTTDEDAESALSRIKERVSNIGSDSEKEDEPEYEFK